MSTRVTDREEIFARILGARERLVSLGVKSIGLFGSFVTGQQTANSDIDLLVEFSPQQHTFDNFMEASFLLEDLLGRDVEVVTPAALSPYIGPHILQEVQRVTLAA